MLLRGTCFRGVALKFYRSDYSTQYPANFVGSFYGIPWSLTCLCIRHIQGVKHTASGLYEWRSTSAFLLLKKGARFDSCGDWLDGIKMKVQIMDFLLVICHWLQLLTEACTLR